MRRDSKSFAALRWGLGLAAVVVLGACSTGLRLGYAYADTLLLYSINSYVGLTPEQEQLVKERSTALIAWHRSTQLRDYAQFIDTTRRKLEGPVTADDVLEFNQAVNARLAALGDRAAPDLAQLALTLTPEQIARMERKFASDNAKARRELAQFAAKATLDDRVKQYAERSEFWFGPLSREQLDIVRRTLEKRPSNAAWWQAEREQRQREMVAVLQRIRVERPSEEQAAGWLRSYFAELRNPPSAERRRATEEARAANAELVAELINAASPEQKSAMSRRFGAYAEDFMALAGDRAAPSPG